MLSGSVTDNDIIRNCFNILHFQAFRFIIPGFQNQNNEMRLGLGVSVLAAGAALAWSGKLL